MIFNFFRGQIVSIYITNSSEACHYVLNNSKANIVVVDTDEQLEKILKIRDKLPHLKAIVKTLLGQQNVEGIWKWSDLEAMKIDKDIEIEYQKRLVQIKPSDCCSVCYTSGTTGNPKGALLSHDNFVWEIESLTTALQCFQRGKETGISYLPLAHMSGQLSEIMMAIWSGATIYFADKDAFKGTLIDTLRAARPTYFVSVPRIYEKFHEKIVQAINETKGLKRILLSWAQSVTLDYHMKKLESGQQQFFSLQYEIAKKLVLTKLKSTLGLDRCRAFYIGAAPVGIEIIKFFLSLDIQLQEVYGMTEATGISFLHARWHRKLTTLGKVVPGLEAKIVNPDEDGLGEIYTRGRNTFMGYMNEPEKTKETIDEDGWIKTGDIGYIDNEGFLHMKGRIKELIITAGGENIPYLHIENLVKNECHAISNTFLIGDKRKFLTMLITLKTKMNSDGAPCDELAPESLSLMKELGLEYKLLSEILNSGPDPKIIEALQAAIDRANKKAISNAQKVQKFAILPNDFSLPTGELNATMKLKRNLVQEKYKEIIESFYI
ncbi:hypothetical protein PVAND_008843 [Polypedilum vanderplanki]|uniref:long-chain-fatty-acid--CoA ligase n=1 Tax=Polypedilum vanderplanki TaxID=319348 RepID=A0A9J6CB87_POLVA|nr:hypothetical protein PVAND_008843 [Polypedilum vanderplanki]